MGDIKLTYFNGRGRGEICRLVMHFAKKKFEDKRIEFDEWPAIKPKTPFGSLPMLEVKGQVFCQSIAIAAYLAKECGLYGKDNLEAIAIHQIQLMREDLLVAEAKTTFEKDEAKKAMATKDLMEEKYPKFMGFFNDFIKKNRNKSGFMVGSKATLADLVILDATESLEPGFLDKYPEVQTLRKKMECVDGIKQYLVKRPVTAF